MRNALLAVLLSATPVAAEPTLVGYARLDAHTFRDGPTSGQFIEQKEHNGVTPPFIDKQPVQGISSLVPMPDKPGSFWALSDNGFGGKANSADYVLCVYEVTPNFDTGEVAWSVAFELSDPNDVITWPTVADGETYPNSEIPVPAAIRDSRLLTGADFDIESLVRLPDGTFWIGDEFGPFLLHFDSEGRLLEPPVELPGEGMHSPDHPTKDPAEAKIGRSSGFEGMVLARADWVHPIAVLERSVDNDGYVWAVSFQPMPNGEHWFLGGPTYRWSKDGLAIGGAELLEKPSDATALGVEPRAFILIERDGEQAQSAARKQLVAVVPATQEQEDAVLDEMLDLDALDADEFGTMRRLADVTTESRRLLADLLDLADPDDLDGDGSDRFRFPYLTIESVAVVDERTVIVCNDNNYPFTNGRPEQAGPDATEFILIRFDKPLAELASDAE
ncbi:MAG: esterase-like activity of phytase family protein [Planctomycetota bacterium]